MELENVLLIGGSGFVGGWIASRLSERGIRVTIPTRHRDNTKKLIMLPMVSMVEANVHDPQASSADAGSGCGDQPRRHSPRHDSRLPYGKRFAAAHMSTCRERSSPPCGKAAFAVWCT
jgi:choline dehydrogenase-like flavoprotein